MIMQGESYFPFSPQHFPLNSGEIYCTDMYYTTFHSTQLFHTGKNASLALAWEKEEKMEFHASCTPIYYVMVKVINEIIL